MPKRKQKNSKDPILEEMLSHLGEKVEETLHRDYDSFNPEHYRLEFKEVYQRLFPGKKARFEEVDLVLIELLGNSCSAIGDGEVQGGHCTVSSYFARRGIVLVVGDSGPGFDVGAKIREIQEGYPFTGKQLLDRLDLAHIPEIRELIDKGGTGLRTLLAFSTHYAHNDRGNKVYVHFEM